MNRFRSLLMPLLLAVPVSAAALVPGDTAPDFLIEDVQGGPAIHLSEHQGQVVLLVFFHTA